MLLKERQPCERKCSCGLLPEVDCRQKLRSQDKKIKALQKNKAMVR